MQAFSVRHFFGAVLGVIPLFLMFLGIDFVEDQPKIAGLNDVPGFGDMFFICSMAFVFVVYSVLFLTHPRIGASRLMKMLYFPIVIGTQIVISLILMLISG
jgi:hypothetical protein